MIKQFIPVTNATVGDEDQLQRMLKDGAFNNAFKLVKKLGLNFDDYPDATAAGVQKLLLRHRAGELLSFVYNYPGLIDIDLLMILRAAFEFGDYHAFLKNCVRLNQIDGLSMEIKSALTKLRLEEAASWATKIHKMKL